MGGKTMFEMVNEFHHAYNVPAPKEATLGSREIQQLRYSLIREELEEYLAAVYSGDLIGIADALADLAYVVLGTAAAHGLVRFDEIFAEVHRSNMSKLGDDGKPILRDDGKVLKGPNFKLPALGSLVYPHTVD